MMKTKLALWILLILLGGLYRTNSNAHTLPPITVTIGLSDFGKMLINGESLPEYAWAKAGEKYDATPSLDQGAGEYLFNVTFIVRLFGATAPKNISGSVFKEAGQSFEDAFRDQFASGNLIPNITQGSAGIGGTSAVGTYQAPNGGFCVYGVCSSASYICESDGSGTYCGVLVSGIPSSSSSSSTFLGCHQPGCALWTFVFSSTYAMRYRIERRSSSLFPWSLVTTVESASYVPHLGQNYLQWRVRGENGFGAGPWTYFTTTGQCGSGGGTDSVGHQEEAGSDRKL